jgi:ribosome maturation factor RimP
MDAQTGERPLQVVGASANPLVGKIWRIADSLCLSEGMELVHVEYGREPGGRTLRIYIDKPGGVMLDDCAQISRQLSDLLDVALDIELAYNLEVSSPGSHRPLGRMSDFERFKGHRVKIRTVRPINGQKSFTGILDGVDGANIQLGINDQLIAIAFDWITKAQLAGSKVT